MRDSKGERVGAADVRIVNEAESDEEAGFERSDRYLRELSIFPRGLLLMYWFVGWEAWLCFLETGTRRSGQMKIG